MNYIGKCQKIGFHPQPYDQPLLQIAEHIQVEYNAEMNVCIITQQIK